MNEAFNEILLQSGIQPVLISDKFAMTIITLVALLHNQVGSDVGENIFHRVW